MSQSISFGEARLKIKRAYKHIREIEEWLEEFRRLNSHRFWVEQDPGTGRNLVKFGPITSPAPEPNESLPPIIGDAVHNIRSALDVVASAIIRAHGGDDSYVIFPMDDSRNALVCSRRYREIQAVAPDLALLIADTIKPYKAGDGNAAFWGLNQLDRMDKHRLLIPSCRLTKVSVHCVDENQPPMELGPGVLIVWPGGQLPAPGSWHHIHNERYGYPTWDVRFDEGQPFENEPVVPTLHQLAELVTGVIDTLEAG